MYTYVMKYLSKAFEYFGNTIVVLYILIIFNITKIKSEFLERKMQIYSEECF